MKEFRITKEMIAMKLSEILKESFGIVDFLPNFRLASDLDIDEHDLEIFLNMIEYHFGFKFSIDDSKKLENIKIGKLIDMISSLINKK